MAKKKNLEEYRDEFVEMYKRGISLNEIAKIYDVTRRSVTVQIAKVMPIKSNKTPEELKKKFYKDYKNGYSINKIAKKYKVGFDTVKRIINSEYEIITSKNLEADDEQLKDIVYDYKNGYSLNKLAEKYNFTSTTIHNYLASCGIKLRDARTSSREYYLDESYFKVLNNEKACDLGIIFASLTLSEVLNTRTLILAGKKDNSYIFSDVIKKFSGKSSYKISRNSNVYRTTINSTVLYDDIVRYGFDSNKLNIDKKYYKDFFKGYFNLNLSVGRGEITIRTKKGKMYNIILSYLINDLSINKDYIRIKHSSFAIYNSDEIMKLLSVHDEIIPRIVAALFRYECVKWEKILEAVK